MPGGKGAKADDDDDQEDYKLKQGEEKEGDDGLHSPLQARELIG